MSAECSLIYIDELAQYSFPGKVKFLVLFQNVLQVEVHIAVTTAFSHDTNAKIDAVFNAAGRDSSRAELTNSLGRSTPQRVVSHW